MCEKDETCNIIKVLQGVSGKCSIGTVDWTTATQCDNIDAKTLTAKADQFKFYRKFKGGYNPVNIESVNLDVNNRGKAVNWKKPEYKDYISD